MLESGSQSGAGEGRGGVCGAEGWAPRTAACTFSLRLKHVGPTDLVWMEPTYLYSGVAEPVAKPARCLRPRTRRACASWKGKAGRAAPGTRASAHAHARAPLASA